MLSEKIKKSVRVSLCVAMFVGTGIWTSGETFAQDQIRREAAMEGKQTLAVGPVKVTAALRARVAREGKASQLEEIAAAMDGQLIDRLQNTRKFTLIAGSQLKELLPWQDWDGASGNVNIADPRAARAFQLAGCKFLAITEISGFTDLGEALEGEGGAVLARRRTIEAVAVVQIYDTTTGILLESGNAKVKVFDKDAAGAEIQADGNFLDKMLADVSFKLATQLTGRVLDVAFPARVVARTDDIITINRGDGTGIAKGQAWDVYALGKVIKDPDTDEIIGSERVKVGEARVIEVEPRMSRAKLTLDNGVSDGMVLRENPDAGLQTTN